MSLYRDEAVVLRTWKLGEADRIVNLHTLANGKVRGVAKGVRRTRSKFGARLEPASHIAVQLHRGRSELHTVTQVATIDRFAGLRRDPDRFARASAMLEAVDQLATEAEPNPDRHVMLVRALATQNDSDNPLVLAAFLLKLLSLEGVQPELDCCIACGASDGLAAMDVSVGGVLCGGCRQGRPLSAEALDLLRRVLGGGLGAALRKPPGAAVREVTAVATDAIEAHLERRLRSVSVLGRD